MASHKSTLKQMRKDKARRERNRAQRSTLRTALKKVRGAIGAGGKSESETRLKAAIKLLDSSASKGLIHRNAAARTKSRLVRQANRLA